ncbi:hypothetical protein BH10ACI2_BH10ACI2_19980 [soil metagenome]
MKCLRIPKLPASTLFLLPLVLTATIVLKAQSVGSTAYLPADKNVAAAKKPDSVNVIFDDKDPNVMIVESNGERFRVNSATKSVERIESAPPSQPPSPPAADAKSKVQDKENYYAYETGDEPFDYRLVNVPTPRKVPKGTWNMSFSHRFSQPLQPFSESGKSLLGLDSMSTSSFGISYGITDKLYVNASRSPVCQSGMCKTIEVGLGYHFADQGENSPLALSAYASVEGNDNFTEEYTYNVQAMVSRQLGKRVFLFFSPAAHFNTNGQHRFNPRPDDYFPAATAALSYKLPTNTYSFGMGTLVRITPSVAGIFEFTPRTGFKLGRVEPIFDSDFNVTGFKNLSQPEMGVGVQYTIGKHSFTLTFSNTQTTTTSRYNSSNLVLSPRHLIIGFNLFRRW